MITVGILFGGKSAEHEVSLQSAKNVYEAIDRSKFKPVLIGIGKDGKWYLNEDSLSLLNSGDPKLISLQTGDSQVALVPESGGILSKSTPFSGYEKPLPKLDVVFPILHGPCGEDGTVQGLLKLAGIPFVGSGVLGSAVSMDKDVMKRLFRDAGLPIGKFLTFNINDPVPPFPEIEKTLGNPLFIKPANMGSSVGISKIYSGNDFFAAMEKAFQYDTKVIVEEFIEGREIECSVLGNENPQASVPGEIIPTHDFYSYEAKYLDENGAELEVPAKLDDETQKRIREMAVRAFQVLCCDGLARVDFFLCKDGNILINEINTIPGFTKISMYPKLWEACGIGYTQLISRLIELAMEKFEKEHKIKITYA